MNPDFLALRHHCLDDVSRLKTEMNIRSALVSARKAVLVGPAHLTISMSYTLNEERLLHLHDERIYRCIFHGLFQDDDEGKEPQDSRLACFK
ncbi:MAG: hypothetical protein JWN14_186 [Chthonomonadales bacterium]|nr:hypothetical protein [Chthonomonadales bacterium]